MDTIKIKKIAIVLLDLLIENYDSEDRESTVAISTLKEALIQNRIDFDDNDINDLYNYINSIEDILSKCRTIRKNLSDKDVIKSYEIDYDETHLNASGNGIETQVFVNGNRDLKISLLISKDKDKYRVGTAVVSKEVSDYVEAEEK